MTAFHKTQRTLVRAWALLVACVATLCLIGPQTALAEESIKEPIKVGATFSLTGRYAAPGQDQLQGIQMWVHDVNSRGALLGRKVKLIHYDDKSDTATSARLYERLIGEDQVDLLLGPYSSDLTLQASTVAEKHNFPMVATGAASGEIWARGYQNIFGVDKPASAYFDLLLASAKNADLKRIALVYAGIDFPREAAQGVREEAAKHGMQIVFDEEYPRDSKDFAALIERMKRSDPEVVVGGTYLNDSIAFMRQAKKSQLSPKAFVFTVGPALQEFGDTLGADAEGVMGVVSWMRSARLPMARDFSYRYKKRYGRNPGVHAAYGYGAGQVLEAAVRLAGALSKDDVRKQLRDMKFRSLLGHYRVDETGKQLAKSIFVMQWQNGKRLLVLPKDIQESQVYYPFKPWSER